MENPAKKELISEIAELFKAHEEHYEAGQWEAFQENKNDSGLFFKRWLNIAAIFFIIAALLPLHLNDLFLREKPVYYATVKEKDDRSSIPVVKATKPALNRTVKPLKNNSTIVFPEITDSIMNTEPAAQVAENLVDTATASSAIGNKKPEITAQINQPKQDIMDFLRRETKKETVKSKKEDDKRGGNWNFGVELAPTLTKSNVNMGTGLITEYKLSKNFSVSSGISFIQLSADQQFNQTAANTGAMSSPSSNVKVVSGKRLISMNANISAIDIPISLTYNLNQKIFTSIGISYFSVLTEKRNNNFLTELPVSRISEDPVTGLSMTYKDVLVGENKEEATNLPLKGNSYLGFFNFSVGRKQEVFNKYNIILEPFIKIPVGKLSNEDLKLTNGGMKLKFSF